MIKIGLKEFGRKLVSWFDPENVGFSPGTYHSGNATLKTLKYLGVLAFQVFLNTSIPEILKSKNLVNESLKSSIKNYYIEILALKYLKIPGTQTPLCS